MSDPYLMVYLPEFNQLVFFFFYSCVWEAHVSTTTKDHQLISNFVIFQHVGKIKMAERHDEIKSFCHEFSPLVVITLDLYKSGRYLLSNLVRILRNCVVLFLVFVFVIVSVSILFKATKSGSGSPSTSSRQVVQGKSLTSKKFKILKCQRTQKLFLAFFGETQGFTAILGKSQYPCSLGQQTRREGIRFLPVKRELCLEKTPDSTDSLNSFWYLELHTYQKDARISFKKL